jgi:sensor histidine kinase YesM
MSARRVLDLYLPARMAYHVRILLAAFLITFFFNFLWKGSFTQGIWLTFALVAIQLEIFFAIALKMFAPGIAKAGLNYKKRIITRLAMFYVIVLVIAIAFVILAMVVPVFTGNVRAFEMPEHFVSEELKRFLISWLISITVASLAFFYMEWNNSLQREQKLREEKLIFQYQTLKNQVSPHFLFNSLNTLSSLIQKDPELSERFINKFCTIYRYILEKADVNMVRLDEEIEFITNYFYLQKIRDDGKIELHVNVDEPELYQTLPISLQLLVENALKHNAATHKNPLIIRIYLEHDNVLVVENNIQKKMSLDQSSKVGLKNLGERISLMLNRHVFIEENAHTFLVKLPIIKIHHEGVDNRG